MKKGYCLLKLMVKAEQPVIISLRRGGTCWALLFMVCYFLHSHPVECYFSKFIFIFAIFFASKISKRAQNSSKEKKMQVLPSAYLTRY